MKFDPNASAGYLIHHAARLFFEELRKRIEPLGIVPGQFPALLALWQQDGQTQTALAEILSIEQATMANTLNRMERDGLVVREGHPTDRRIKVVRLTPKATAIRDEAYAAATSVNDMALAGMSPDERTQFLRSLSGTITKLKST